MKLGFIGFGAASFGLTKGLRQAGLEEVHFFDNMQDTPPYGEVICRRGVETGAIRAASVGELVARADVLISCVTGARALSAAGEAEPFLRANHLYADVNTASPSVKAGVARIVEKTGAAFCDAAMMGAIPSFLHRVPIVASGGGAARFQECLSPYGMNIRVIGIEPGQASALKLFRSIFMKGLLALFIETLTATHRCGVDETVLASIAESLDGIPFLETARVQMTKGVVNAERMAHEMEEVIATLEELGVPAGMSRASRETLLRCAELGLRERFGGELPTTLAEVLRAMEDQSGSKIASSRED